VGEHVIYAVKHAIEGAIDFRAAGSQVRIVVNWPFDFETDEWITLSADIPREDLAGSAISIRAQGPGGRVGHLQRRRASHQTRDQDNP
jgi:hypothetical protein